MVAMALPSSMETIPLRLRMQWPRIPTKLRSTNQINRSPQAATLDLDVEGSHDHPSARIEMIVLDVETNDRITLDGEVSDGAERISGTLTFPNGSQQQVTMRRE